jgi:hypothetical protein
MKPALLLLMALGAASPRSTAFTVTTSVTAITLSDPTVSRSFRLDNRGAYSIWCRYQLPSETSTPSFVAGQGMEIEAGTWASFPALPLWCIAATASQTGCSGSATDCTWVTEVP